MIRERLLQAELMDQPDLDPALHVQALRGLRRINVVSRTSAILWPALASIAQQVGPRRLRILDIACGGGDNAVALAQQAQRANVAVSIDGCDISNCAIDEARRRAAEASAEGLSFFQRDVLAQPLPAGYDVLTTSLFLHHLQEEQARQLLARMGAAADRGILVCDLQRSWLGYGLAWIGCRVLTRSKIVHVDGPRSVEAAFATAEIGQLAESAGLDGAAITHHWPQRWLLDWRKC